WKRRHHAKPGPRHRSTRQISLSGSGEGPGWETSRPTLQSPFARRMWVFRRLPPATTVRWRQWGKTERGALGRDGTRAEGCNHRHGAHWASEPTPVVAGLGDPVTWCLAGTGRRNGGWVCREFQMAEDLANDLTLRDDGNESQHPALTKGTHGGGVSDLLIWYSLFEEACY